MAAGNNFPTATARQGMMVLPDMVVRGPCRVKGISTGGGYNLQNKTIKTFYTCSTYHDLIIIKSRKRGKTVLNFTWLFPYREIKIII